MNQSDLFYEKVTKNILIYLLEHKPEESKIGVGLALEYIASDLGSNKYDELARNFADIGLLVGGALEIQNRASKGKPRNLELDRAVIMDALRVYENKRITPEAIAGTLRLSYENFNRIIGGDFDSFVGAVSSAYNLAMQEHGIVVPDKDPEDFLIKTVLRQKIHKNVRKIENVFLATPREKWEEKVLKGDVSDYTVAMPLRFGQYNLAPVIVRGGASKAKMKGVTRSLEMIEEFTELPILEIIVERDKNSFPTTYEYKVLSDDELKEIITSGVNEYLDMLETHHKQDIERYGDSLREGNVKYFGKEGCLFNEAGLGVIQYIILNDEIINWDGGEVVDVNLWYSPRAFLGKMDILDSDGYIDSNKLKSKWLSSAVNEYITRCVKNLINFYESENYDGDDFGLKNEVEELVDFSVTAGKFVAEESKNSLKELESRLNEDI